MKGYLFLACLAFVLASCKSYIPQSSSYIPQTEHQYEIKLINDSILYQGISIFLTADELEKSKNGNLLVSFEFDLNAVIKKVEIVREINFFMNNETDILEFLKNKASFAISSNAKKYFATMHRDVIVYKYNFKGEIIYKYWKGLTK